MALEPFGEGRLRGALAVGGHRTAVDTAKAPVRFELREISPDGLGSDAECRREIDDAHTTVGCEPALDCIVALRCVHVDPSSDSHTLQHIST
ncbi:hypothetical protein GCM10027024_32060 [Microbacterium insulae]